MSARPWLDLLVLHLPIKGPGSAGGLEGGDRGPGSPAGKADAGQPASCQPRQGPVENTKGTPLHYQVSCDKDSIPHDINQSSPLSWYRLTSSVWLCRSLFRSKRT